MTFDPATYPQLHLTDPPVWWPYQMGDQPLEELTVIASVGGVESDRASTSFGIREVTSEYMPNGARRFLINGQPILIRGGGWASDMLLRPEPQRVDDQLMYVRDMGLNAVRLEGKLESDHFFDEADRFGILVMPGWMCCDYWQQSWRWTAAEQAIARASMTSQAVRMRNHPSVITFMIGSDTKPVLGVQEMYVKALRDARWPNPILASASGDTSSVLGPTGVKMTGPYDWVPPGYWYDPRADGGAEGFNTETSAGQSIPELEDVRRMLSPDEREALWTEPRTPQYHAGVGDSVFKTFHIFDRAMTARMGAPTSLADYVRKAQVMAYENERAMFEAFSRNRYGSTGADPVDAQQRVAVVALEPVRLVPGAERLDVRGEGRERAPARPVRVRRPLGRGDRPDAGRRRRPDRAGPGVRPPRRRALESIHHDGRGCGRGRASVPGAPNRPASPRRTSSS